MDKELEIIELVIDDGGEVSAIALVDMPAIESNWMAFSKQQSFRIENEEKRIVSGYLMKADLPILRLDGDREFYVVFRKDTIKDIVFKFMKEGLNDSTNLMHNSNEVAEGVFLFESLLIDSERGIKAPNNFEDAPDGSWWGSMRVENDEIWKDIKEGKFRGFSVEGMFKEGKSKSMEEQKIEKIKELLKDL